MKLWTDCISPGSAIYDWVDKPLVTYDWEESQWVNAVVKSKNQPPNHQFPDEKYARCRIQMNSFFLDEAGIEVGKALLKLNKKNGCLLITHLTMGPDISVGLGWTKYGHYFPEAGGAGNWPPTLPFWLFKGMKNKCYLRRMVHCCEVMQL